MKLDSRLKKLEEKSGNTQGKWATFVTKNYEDPIVLSKVKQRLLNDYIAEGNAAPTGIIYWNEIVPEMGIKDAFTGSYPTNPLEDIMNRIAEQARDPLDDLE